jgi:membrane associated rhomboid family serine protease
VFPLKDNIPTDRFPLVTVVLVAANVAVYVLLQQGLLGLPGGGAQGEWPVPLYGAIPCELTGQGACDVPAGGPPAWVTPLTSMFMHGGILHLAGNMLFLWIFGNNVEDSMGRLRFVGFYLAGGVVALAAQTALDPGAEIPTIGASGAVAAVLGGYILLYPRARVVTVVFIVFLFTIVELPAMLLLGVWFLQQALFAYFDAVTPTGDGGGVAYLAHVGGFVFGLLVIRALARRRKSVPPRFGVH